VNVVFVNEDKSPGLKRGGVLTVVRQEVELNVQADSIPESVVVDLDGVNIGDVIHINDTSLPEGVKPTIARNFVIANISAPSGLRSSDAEEAAG
jgi:large subunit ribosomal protein L25